VCERLRLALQGSHRTRALARVSLLQGEVLFMYACVVVVVVVDFLLEMFLLW